MGMSTHVVGFRDADEAWIKMERIWDACKAAGVRPPKEVEDFFCGEDPGDKPGAEVSIGSAAVEWSDESRSGYQIDISKLPKGLRYIRVYNSW